MTKELLSKAIHALKNISINFRIDYFMNKDSCLVRGIFLDNPEDVSKVKSLLDSEILKNIKFKKSKSWYLGDEKEVVYMQLKQKIIVGIEELEGFQVSNYA